MKIIVNTKCLINGLNQLDKYAKWATDMEV